MNFESGYEHVYTSGWASYMRIDNALEEYGWPSSSSINPTYRGYVAAANEPKIL